MHGGLPRILRTPHYGALAAGSICQSMRRAWWGPQVDNMRAQAMKLLANMGYLSDKVEGLRRQRP